MTYNTKSKVRSRKVAEPYHTQRVTGRQPKKTISPSGDMMDIAHDKTSEPSVLLWCPPCMEYRQHTPRNGARACCRCGHVRFGKPESAFLFTEVERREPNRG